jgi:predicted metal-binding protein
MYQDQHRSFDKQNAKIFNTITCRGCNNNRKPIPIIKKCTEYEAPGTLSCLELLNGKEIGIQNAVFLYL